MLVGALFPLLALALRQENRTLGANPISAALNELGLLALVLLIASLACTPIKVVTGWVWPIRLRRTLGLLAFLYASLHFLTYAALDQGLALGAIWKDVSERPFIFVGMAALVLMVPLALTSFDSSVRKLGFVRWKRLHRLAYVSGILGAIHFIWRVKKDVTEPMVYTGILCTLFAVRAFDWARTSARARARARSAPH